MNEDKITPRAAIQQNPTKIGGSTNHDQQIWEDIDALIKKSGMNMQDVVENFMLFYRRVNFAKFLTHIEIFKEIVDRPGSIVECGVFKGASFLTFLKLVEIHCPGDTLKKLIGFDTFKGFPSLSDKDGTPNPDRDLVEGGFNSEDFLPCLEEVIDLTQRDSMIPRFKRVELVKGDVTKTIPEYVEKNPGLRISLLHLDMDIYEPTLTALQHLYPLVVPGGIVLFDEYAMPGFPGESQAFDEYFGGEAPVMKKFPFISTPGGYFVKGSKS